MKPKEVKLPSYEEDPSRTAPVGAFNVSPVGSASRKKVEKAIANAIATRQSQSAQPQVQPQPIKVEPFVNTTVKNQDPPPKPDKQTSPVIPLTTASNIARGSVPGPGGGKKTKNNKLRFGAPQQARGKIGRRQNPQ